MQLEEAYTVEIIKLVEYVDRKEDPLTQNVRKHQHYSNSAVLQRTGCLKTEVWRGTKQVHDSIAEKTKERLEWKRMHQQLPCRLGWILNSHIDG